MVEELTAQGYEGEALIQRVMDLTGLDRSGAVDLIATETGSPDGDLIDTA